MNGIEYNGIYLEKQTAFIFYTNARFLNMSYAVHNIRSLYKLLSSYRDRCIQNTVKHLRWNVLLNGRVRGVYLGYFNNQFVKDPRKRDPIGKHFGIFSPRYS